LEMSSKLIEISRGTPGIVKRKDLVIIKNLHAAFHYPKRSNKQDFAITYS
jgi:hypothetical protein